VHPHDGDGGVASCSLTTGSARIKAPGGRYCERMLPLDASLLVVALLAVLAPLLVRALSRWVRIPIVVFELALGIAVGPSVLGLVSESDILSVLADFGLAMLFFVAGTEIQAGVLVGRSGRRAIGGWVVSLVAGVALGWAVAPGDAAVIIGIALCSTALGALLPILRDAKELRTPFGRSVSAVGAVGEFGPLLAISIFLGGRTPGVSTIVLLAFVAIAAAAVVVAVYVPRGALHRAVNASLHTSGQFAIRVVFLILAALVTLSIVLDLDMLLGAFAAGVLWRILMRDAAPADREAVDSKLEAVAFGFLVPLFFIATGIAFDLQALLSSPWHLLLVPAVAVALLVVRGVPASFAAPPGAPRRDRVALVFLGATGLPIIVAVTAIAVDGGLLSSVHAAVLVAGGMLSVLVFPLVAMQLRRGSVRSPAPSSEGVL
jgi:Kef-type K+ transport system membrane component KefB